MKELNESIVGNIIDEIVKKEIHETMEKSRVQNVDELQLMIGEEIDEDVQKGVYSPEDASEIKTRVGEWRNSEELEKWLRTPELVETGITRETLMKDILPMYSQDPSKAIDVVMDFGKRYGNDGLLNATNMLDIVAMNMVYLEQGEHGLAEKSLQDFLDYIGNNAGLFKSFDSEPEVLRHYAGFCAGGCESLEDLVKYSKKNIVILEPLDVDYHGGWGRVSPFVVDEGGETREFDQNAPIFGPEIFGRFKGIL